MCEKKQILSSGINVGSRSLWRATEKLRRGGDVCKCCWGGMWVSGWGFGLSGVSLDPCGDGGDDSLNVVEDVVVGEAQNSDAEAFQVCLALGVSFSGVVVNRAINFDGEEEIGSEEIYNEATDRLLAMKVVTQNLAPFRSIPEKYLRIRSIFSKLARTYLRLRRSLKDHTSSRRSTRS